MTDLHSNDLEMDALGAALLTPEAFATVRSVLNPEHFFNPHHRKFYGAMLELSKNGKPLEQRLLAEHLGKAFGSMGGASFYVQLLESPASPLNADHYAGQVLELFKKRSLHASLKQAVSDLQKGKDFGDVLQAAQEATLGVSEGRGAVVRTVKELMLSPEWDEEPGHVKTGIDALDRRTGGFRKCALTVVGGKTHMGKTSFKTSCAYNAARAGARVLFATYEMDGMSIVKERLLGVAGSDETLFDVADRILIYDTAVLAGLGADDSVEALCATAIAEHMKVPLDVVFVDFIQLVKTRERYEKRYIELGTVARALAALSLKLTAAVVASSQLSREAKQEPDLNDLKESGDIENAASLVLFPVRPSYFDPTSQPPEKEPATCIIAKNRFGGDLGRVPIWWEGNRRRFYG